MGWRRRCEEVSADASPMMAPILMQLRFELTDEKPQDAMCDAASISRTLNGWRSRATE